MWFFGQISIKYSVMTEDESVRNHGEDAFQV